VTQLFLLTHQCFSYTHAKRPPCQRLRSSRQTVEVTIPRRAGSQLLYCGVFVHYFFKFGLREGSADHREAINPGRALSHLYEQRVLSVPGSVLSFGNLPKAQGIARKNDRKTLYRKLPMAKLLPELDPAKEEHAYLRRYKRDHFADNPSTVNLLYGVSALQVCLLSLGRLEEVVRLSQEIRIRIGPEEARARELLQSKAAPEGTDTAALLTFEILREEIMPLGARAAHSMGLNEIFCWPLNDVGASSCRVAISHEGHEANGILPCSGQST
jgi:hypothetical protein